MDHCIRLPNILRNLFTNQNYTQIPSNPRNPHSYVVINMVKITPRIFTGEQDSSGNVEDPQTWLNHFNKVSISNGWNTDALKIQHFPVSLLGEAEAWYEINNTWIETVGCLWRMVQDRMIERFRPSNYQEELEDMLRHPVMKEGESIHAYEE